MVSAVSSKGKVLVPAARSIFVPCVKPTLDTIRKHHQLLGGLMWGFFGGSWHSPIRELHPAPGGVMAERWLPKEARLATRTDVPRARSGCGTRRRQGVLNLVTTRAQSWADTEVAAQS